jgi:hypothetical protein
VPVLLDAVALEVRCAMLQLCLQQLEADHCLEE